MPDNIGSLDAFTFDFRGHGHSSDAPTTGEGFLMDARAALAHARDLPHVDLARVITMGTSIGAASAVDVCVVLDGSIVAVQQLSQGCLGALSFSPGNFLNLHYIDAIDALGETFHDAIVCCLMAENDSPEVCQMPIGDHCKPIIYPGNAHGEALIEPSLDPGIDQVILDFLLGTLG